MLPSVMLIAVATAAAFHNTDGKPEAKYSLNENEMVDNNRWLGERMEIMEIQMKKFGDITEEQGKKIEKAENEIEKLKATIQRQGAEMKLMENKLDKYEAIVIEQRKTLDDKEIDIQDLKVAVHKQDKETDRIKEEIITMKGNLHIEDFQKKELEKTNIFNTYQESKTGKPRNQANAKSGSFVLQAQSFMDVLGQENTDSGNFTIESFIEMHYTPSEEVLSNSKSTYYKDIKEKSRLKEIVSLPHQNLRIQQRQVRNSGVAFTAYLSHRIENMGIGHTIKCDQVLLNDGNAYSAYSGTFTVPQSGVYLLTFSIAAYSLHAQTNVKLVSNNRNIVDAIVWVKDSSHHVMGGNTAIVRLNSAEKVWLEIYSKGGVQLYSLPDYRWVTFSGVLLY